MTCACPGHNYDKLFTELAVTSLQQYMVERVLKSPNVQDEYHASSAVLWQHVLRQLIFLRKSDCMPWVCCVALP